MSGVPPDAPFLSIGFAAHELCTRCGSCAGVCPADAIALDERGFPRLIADRCTACGQCVDACPQDIAVPAWLEKAQAFLAPG